MLNQVVLCLKWLKQAGGTVPPWLVHASFKFYLANCFVLFQLLDQQRNAQLFGMISTFPHCDMLTAYRVPVVRVQRSNSIDWASVNCSQIFGQ
jgi:hypothetical protein